MKSKTITGNKGFTLTELLVVMAIIGILGTVGVTAYVGATLKAARSEAYSNLEGIKVLQSQFVAETGVYAASAGVCAADSPGNIAAINALLPGFQPGTGLQFSYCIEQDLNIAGAGQVPCFRAQAFGNTPGRANGDVFMIDCNNNRNF